MRDRGAGVGLSLACLVLALTTCVSSAQLQSTSLPLTPLTPRRAPPPTLRLPLAPQGFRVTLISEQPKIGTAITREDNYFYVAELQAGNILRLADTDGNGLLDTSVVVASNFKMPRSLAIHPQTGDLYVVSRGQINALHDTNGDGIADENRIVIQGLYDLDYMHSSNGIAFGPDGKLYIADGGPRLRQRKKKGAAFPSYAGTILIANPDGSDLRVYASGFRNPFGLAFAADGSLYATENGEDSVQAPVHGDELNRIFEGGDYGFPDVLGDPPSDSDTIAPIVNSPADSAPAGVIVYEAEQFPENYRGNVLVALWNIGHKIVRVWQDASGQWQTEDFITDLKFPVGMTLGADGSLYILDMTDGVNGAPNLSSRIYRVQYAP